MKFSLLLILCLVLSGCASVSEGIANAFLKKQDEKDTRLCEVMAKSFGGIEPFAFSDPNDLLSYTIPPQFVDQQLDARLCIEATNILINVADVHDLLGFGKIANPLTSHTAYSSDDRVIALIAKGIGNPNTSSLVLDKCKWTRLVD